MLYNEALPCSTKYLSLMDFDRLLLARAGLLGVGEPGMVDNSETVYISSLALLKMLKHGRAGVPMEVVSN